MTSSEFFFRVLIAARPLFWAMFGVLVATIAVLPVLLYHCNTVWVNQKKFGWLGMFYCLTTYECVRLACCWVKLVLLLIFVVQFQELSTVHYLAFLLPGVIYSFDLRTPLQIPVRLIWVVLQTVGLVCINLICSYMIDVKVSFLYLALYIFLGIFLLLFGLYSFITELSDLAQERRNHFGEAEYLKARGKDTEC